MCRWICLFLLCLMLAVPLYAQDDTPTLYEFALQRIEAARETNATELDLSWMGLTDVPPEIGQLNRLEVLYLQHNQLRTLLPEIGQLRNLQLLSLEQNQLMSLPPEIRQLGNLWNLRLHGNQLMSLPPEIGQLSSLYELGISENRLITLPSEVGQLSNLHLLNLRGNQLTSLPPTIGQLSKLCLLDLADNNLRHLPAALGNLNLTEPRCGITGLSLHGNPLISPPPEVVEQGTAAVLNYLRNQAWYHTQRLMIGAAGGVGLFTLLVLCLRWKQRDGRKLKQKRV